MLTHLLKLFDVDANVNDERRILTALAAIDRELNLLDNASRGDSLGVIAPINFSPHRATRSRRFQRGLCFKYSELASSESARFSCNHDS
jgi:hypothetical protein